MKGREIKEEEIHDGGMCGYVEFIAVRNCRRVVNV